MGESILGGIVKHQDLKRFDASPDDVTPKDQINLMARNWFSLIPGRTEPIIHEYVDSSSGYGRMVKITGNAEHGIATMYDQDLLIFAISQWVEAKRLGLEPSRRIFFKPYQFFAWLGIKPAGKAYARLKDNLNRLKTTTVETTIQTQKGKRQKKKIRQFSWISEWEIQEESGEVRGVEVVLAEWLFESIQNFHVLTLDNRYFEIYGTMERWLYLYARKATGGPSGIWKETFKSLYRKSAALSEYKHFANKLRKVIAKNELPGFRLESVKSSQGKDMLLMERLREEVEATGSVNEFQPELIEKTPAEEMWENILQKLRQSVPQEEITNWLAKLSPVETAPSVLCLRAPTEFIKDWVENRYRPRILAASKSLQFEVTELVFVTGKPSR